MLSQLREGSQGQTPTQLRKLRVLLLRSESVQGRACIQLWGVSAPLETYASRRTIMRSFFTKTPPQPLDPTNCRTCKTSITIRPLTFCEGCQSWFCEGPPCRIAHAIDCGGSPQKLCDQKRAEQPTIGASHCHNENLERSSTACTTPTTTLNAR